MADKRTDAAAGEEIVADSVEPQAFEQLVADWWRGIRLKSNRWERFTRLTLVLVIVPVLPVPFIGMLLASLQLVLIGRKRMHGTQFVPLVIAAVLGCVVTCVMAFWVYPLAYRSFWSGVDWLATGHGQLADLLSHTLRAWGRLFMPGWVSPPSAVVTPL